MLMHRYFTKECRKNEKIFYCMVWIFSEPKITQDQPIKLNTSLNP